MQSLETKSPSPCYKIYSTSFDKHYFSPRLEKAATLERQVDLGCELRFLQSFSFICGAKFCVCRLFLVQMTCTFLYSKNIIFNLPHLSASIPGNKKKVRKVRFSFLSSHITLLLGPVPEGCITLVNRYHKFKYTVYNTSLIMQQSLQALYCLVHSNLHG